MLNFGQKVEEKSGDVIPKDTLLWCILKIRGIKNSQSTNGRYYDLELTVAPNQPYANRKLWDKLADPFDQNNSEEWRQMAYGTIRRVLEAVKGAVPDNPNSYTLNRIEDLDGLTVPVLIGIEKGKDGYDDKNRAEYLSPFSSVKKIVEAHKLLAAGTHTYGKPNAAPAPQGVMFGQQPQGGGMPAQAPAAPAAAAPGWLAPAGQQAAPAAPQAQPGAPAAGWTPPAQQQQPQAGFQQPAPNQPSAPTPAMSSAPAPYAAAPQQGGMPAQAPQSAQPVTSPSNQPAAWQPPQGAPMPAQMPGTGQPNQ